MGNDQHCCQDEKLLGFQNQIPSFSEELQHSLAQRKPYDNKMPKRSNILKFGNNQLYEGRIDHNEQPQGIGRMYKTDGSMFIGLFNKGEPEGHGYYFLRDGTYFEGNIKNNMINDQNGLIKGNNIRYEGGIVNNLFHGEGKEEGEQYSFDGFYKKGIRIKGKLQWRSNGQKFVYKGSFDANGKFSKSGILEQPCGKYEGSFLNGKKHGYGTFIYYNKLKYVGEYANGKKQGKGTIFNSDDSVAYDGFWKNDVPHGDGILLKENGEQEQTKFFEGIDIRYLDPLMMIPSLQRNEATMKSQLYSPRAKKESDNFFKKMLNQVQVQDNINKHEQQKNGLQKSEKNPEEVHKEKLSQEDDDQQINILISSFPLNMQKDPSKKAQKKLNSEEKSKKDEQIIDGTSKKGSVKGKKYYDVI